MCDDLPVVELHQARSWRTIVRRSHRPKIDAAATKESRFCSHPKYYAHITDITVCPYMLVHVVLVHHVPWYNVRSIIYFTLLYLGLPKEDESVSPTLTNITDDALQ